MKRIAWFVIWVACPFIIAMDIATGVVVLILYTTHSQVLADVIGVPLAVGLGTAAFTITRHHLKDSR